MDSSGYHNDSPKCRQRKIIKRFCVCMESLPPVDEDEINLAKNGGVCVSFKKLLTFLDDDDGLECDKERKVGWIFTHCIGFSKL
ncbi:hypothetical protein Pmani_005058 [Petrolisthes manimaculis]|uniref:Uncharacterized protein n=1 Tax=Petrolisthes manimaculis TaxID=1843537 RepID=A0AAE1QD29_9EUCA|nr:hypothetical protein Pmani_005058 [Petrolisthes manimaculis]